MLFIDDSSEIGEDAKLSRERKRKKVVPSGQWIGRPAGKKTANDTTVAELVPLPNEFKSFPTKSTGQKPLDPAYFHKTETTTDNNEACSSVVIKTQPTYTNNNCLQ